MSDARTSEEKLKVRRELRNARRAYDNAEHRLRAAEANMEFAGARLVRAESAANSEIWRAAQQKYHADADGDLEGYDGA